MRSVRQFVSMGTQEYFETSDSTAGSDKGALSLTTGVSELPDPSADSDETVRPDGAGVGIDDGAGNGKAKDPAMAGDGAAAAVPAVDVPASKDGADDAEAKSDGCGTDGQDCEDEDDGTDSNISAEARHFARVQQAAQHLSGTTVVAAAKMLLCGIFIAPCELRLFSRLGIIGILLPFIFLPLLLVGLPSMLLVLGPGPREPDCRVMLR